ncbi:MAG TPA: RsmG family class I SAM-dependent methyltransferase [Thermoanaerobaculia bacterium]|nr:RsmG family class I SAM-dependent methyltransferase [Thermoanaerobaculia bacterium]
MADDVVERLAAHYEELRRWSGRLSLIGPGTADEVVERHFGESLAALPYLAEPEGRLVDLGSGAGFPGLVLAAARPAWQVTLVEAQERKWAFLQAAGRHAGLSCRYLNARVAALLPPGFPDAYEVVTMRALRLPSAALAALRDRLSPRGRLLLWAGAESPTLPAGLAITAETPLAGSLSRRLLRVERT